MIAVRTPRFQLGKVVATPGAIEALAQARTSAWTLLTRHVSGDDFGEVDAEDRQANLDAIRDGSRILSAYTLTTGVRLWVVTEAVDDSGHRAATTLLLPDEY